MKDRGKRYTRLSTMNTVKDFTNKLSKPLLRRQSNKYCEEDENVENEISPCIKTTTREAKETDHYKKKPQHLNSPLIRPKPRQGVLKNTKSLETSPKAPPRTSLTKNKSLTELTGEDEKTELEKKVVTFKDETGHRRRSNTMYSLTSLDGVTSCSICFGTLKEARMLPCQHTFCLPCLEDYVKGNVSCLKCPTCRTKVELPSGGVKTLPSNITIQTVLEALKAEYYNDDGKKRCKVCRTKCSSNKATQCEHCKQTLCLVCLPQHMQELHKQLQKFNEQLATHDEQITLGSEDFKARCEKLLETISSTVQEKIENLLQEEEKLKEGLQKLIQQDEQDSQKLRLNVATCRQQLEGAMVQSPTNGTWASEFLTLHGNCSNVMKQIQCNWRPQLLFDPESFNIQINLDHSPGSPRRLSQEELDSPGQEGGSMSWHRSVIHRNTVVKTWLQRPSCLVFSPWNDNELFVVSTDTHQIFVLNRSGEHVRNFGRRGHSKGQFLCPCGIATYARTGEIYVTDKWRHCVLVFSKDGKFLREFGRKGRSPGHLRSPEGIDIDDDGHLYICDTCNDRVHVLSTEGEFIREIGKITTTKHADGKVYRKSEFNEPCDVKMGADGKVVVCDSGHARIKVYDVDGTFLHTIGNQGAQKGQFNSPMCVTVDREGFLLVGDSGNGRVQVFSPTGAFMRSFGSFSWIRGIAISKENDIVTTDFKSHKVKFFHVD